MLPGTQMSDAEKAELELKNKAGAVSVPDEGGEPAPEPAPEPKPEDDLKVRLAKAEGIIEGLKGSSPSPSEPPKLTATVMENFSEDQWLQIEEKTGKQRSEILQMQRNKELSDQNVKIQAKLNLNDALDAAASTDRDVPKLKKFYKEYFSDIPESEMLNEVNLERHMKKAASYARGRYMQENPGAAKRSATPAPAGRSPNPNSVEDENNNDDKSYAEGEVKDGAYRLGEAGATVNIQRPANWKEIQSQERGPNDICIRAKYEAPKFAGRN